MSEIDTSRKAVERLIASGKRAGKAADITAMLRALLLERDSFKRIAGEVDAMLGKVAAERDALAARVALAEGMAEALQKIIEADWWDGTGKAGDETDEVDGRCAEIARAALAAWRAAAATEDAESDPDPGEDDGDHASALASVYGPED